MVIRQRAVHSEDKQERHHAILDAAERLLERAPERVANVAEVADEAGLAKGTVYLYFPSKDELLLAVHERRVDAFFRALCSLLAATAQVFTLVTPATGLLAFVFTTFFALLLWNTLAVEPDRRQLLRSLLVVFGGAFVLKFVVLAAIYEPQGGLLRRVMLTLLEGVSLGTLGFVPDGAATGYLAFVTLGLYFVALIMLPADRSQSRRHDGTMARRIP